MAKPNFNFQKRQKEIARQKKKEEKRLKKLERSAENAPAEGDLPTEATAEQAGSEEGGEDQAGASEGTS